MTAVTVIALPTSAAAGAGYLIVLAALLGVYGLIHSRIWPLTACWRCLGRGKFRAPGGRSWRRCPRCGGSGERRRVWSGKGDRRG
jgi:hypothetical protein